jgi:hypothetical protein
MEELCQPVGNAKICGEFDWDAATALVLARRYKILGRIDADSFKAHDLALDQTVKVRQAMLTSRGDGDIWRQKVQQLASVRDPNFLNVLDLISDKSGEFIITERPRGQSIAEVLRERFDLEDLLRLMTPLASALDFAAAFACCANPISASWLFTETRRSCAVDSEPPFIIKLDIWELVRPRKNIAWPSLTSKPQRGDQKGLAVRQAALLTYELLRGEQIKESGVQRWHGPVRELSDAANGVLYDGLQGSPLFENTGCFFDRLESANRSGDGNSKALHAPTSPIREYSMALPGTSDVIRRFNRDTARLAMQVVGGVVVLAVLVLAALVKERDPKAADLTEEARQAEGDFLLNANPAMRFTVVDLNGKSSTGKMTSKQATRVNRSFTEISPKENSSSQMEAAAATPTPVLAFTPEINRHDVQANAGSWTAAHRQDSGRVIGLKVPRARSRSSVGLRFVDVKMRLIALWHQSLVRSEKSRTWTGFSNP